MAVEHRYRSINFAALVLLGVMLVRPAIASARPPGVDGDASFPEVSDSWSPDGRFVLKNVDTPQDPRTPHAIYLTDMRTGQRAVLYTYARRVDLLWSPGSNALAINDWATDDEASCIVFVLTPARERIDLREAFLKSGRPDREKKLAADRSNFDHNYAHLVRWLNANTLVFAIEGHNSRSKRTLLFEYEYRLGDSFHPRRHIIR